MTHKAIICLVPLMLSACNFNATRPDPATDKSQPSTLTESSAVAPVARSSAFTPETKSPHLPPPEDNTNLWSVITDELQFDRHIDQQSVKSKIAWFARHQDYLDRVSDRARPYLFHIVSELKERNMPLDLALLPIVESAYHPFAYSPSHAAGIWQFIPATGRRYGMKQNWWYDGRRDIIAATAGALDYLQDLHKRFNGNWLHAIAAYNTGEGNVEKAIRRNQKVGKKTDFWSLRLPSETRSYVPSLLAVAEVLKNNATYNITLKNIPNKVYFESVAINSQIDLAVVAKLTGLAMDEVYTLNPGFNRWATDPNGPHRLLIPVAKARDFKARLAALPDSEHIAWRQHPISRGESLSSIAARYQTSVTTLKKLNRLTGNIIRTGHSLLIPVAKEAPPFYSLSADVRKLKGRKKSNMDTRYIYSVKRGDNLWFIARHYGLSVKQLTKWNGISSKSILKPGQKLTLRLKQNNKTPAAYIVQAGDSLWLIAKKFDVRIHDLLKWNNIKKGKYLQPGQSLIVQKTIADA